MRPTSKTNVVCIQTNVAFDDIKGGLYVGVFIFERQQKVKTRLKKLKNETHFKNRRSLHRNQRSLVMTGR